MTKLVRFDWAMKYLLRNKANFDILEGFLSELLKTDVRIETLLESESNKEHSADKYNRVDLIVRTNKKERVLIEVQACKESDFLSRVLYGTSKAVTEFLREGSSYKDICKVISVNIIFFKLGEGEDYLYHGRTEFRGMHVDDILQLGPSEKRIYEDATKPGDIFPEYYLIRVDDFNERIKNKFDEWVYFLKTEKVEPGFDAQGLQSAAAKLDVLKLNDEDRAIYQRYQENRHYEASMVLTAKVEREMLLEQGIEQGIEQGVEKSQKAIVQHMKTQGLTDGDIAALTGLTDEVIAKL